MTIFLKFLHLLPSPPLPLALSWKCVGNLVAEGHVPIILLLSSSNLQFLSLLFPPSFLYCHYGQILPSTCPLPKRKRDFLITFICKILHFWNTQKHPSCHLLCNFPSPLYWYSPWRRVPVQCWLSSPALRRFQAQISDTCFTLHAKFFAEHQWQYILQNSVL